ncbi:MAG: hypothetical protein WBX11_17705 [Thiobacillaceae bacterium]
MNLHFEPTFGGMQLSSNLGMCLFFSLRLKDTSDTFDLASGFNLRECTFALTIFPISQSPYEEKLNEDGRLGEFRPAFTPPKKDSLYRLWLHVNVDQFNTLYAEASKGNLPSDIAIGVNYDNEEPDGLTEGVFDDASIGGQPLAIRDFLFTLQLAGAQQSVIA